MQRFETIFKTDPKPLIEVANSKEEKDEVDSPKFARLCSSLFVQPLYQQ